MTNTTNDKAKECALEGCHCNITDAEHPITTANGVYCCQGCAQGKGCDHSGCGCGA